MQRLLGVLGSLITLPLVACLAIAIRVDSRGPVLYRADRVGRDGLPFTCFKLRTMHWRPASTGPRISISVDPRVTRVGSALRATRLDELPQLWNVARGEMVLVGPRPEDPRFIDLADPIHAIVFRATPGITGATQLAFADEAAVVDPLDPEGSYRELVLPDKLTLDLAYLRTRSLRLDLWILWQTARTALGRPPDPDTVRHRLGIN